MTRSLAALPFALLLVSAAGAQQSPSEVTDSQLMRYRFIAEEDCRAAARKEGHPAEAARTACQCGYDVLIENMTRAEWQTGYFYYRQQLVREESKVFAPYLPKLKHCALPRKSSPPRR